jgi:hypothetical protein
MSGGRGCGVGLRSKCWLGCWDWTEVVIVIVVDRSEDVCISQICRWRGCIYGWSLGASLAVLSNWTYMLWTPVNYKIKVLLLIDRN